MKLLLTSAGIRNATIQQALVDLLGKPIEESSALVVPTGIYPFLGGGARAMDLMRGIGKSPLTNLGWKSLGILELTALPSIKGESWVPTLEETDALLVWGGNATYLTYWMRQAGMDKLLPTLTNLVYVGVSAGAICTTPFNCDADSNLQFVPEGSDLGADAEHGLGFVDFTLWVHVGNADPIFEEHNLANIERWAAGIPVPTYALDDESAIKVVGSTVEVVSEGNWSVFNSSSAPL
jgi:dipeptidase E